MLQLLQIQQYLREGRMAEALADLQVLVVREPDNGRARAMLGQLFMNQLQDYPSAEEHFRAAMRLVPAWPELYYDYCRLLLLLGLQTQFEWYVSHNSDCTDAILKKMQT